LKLRTESVAPPNGALDTGLRRRAFPPNAASLLPGVLTLTGTGLTPAGEHKLARRSPHAAITSQAGGAHALDTLCCTQRCTGTSLPNT
jgi:hypothetical protein